jgi:hypothetical protein
MDPSGSLHLSSQTNPTAAFFAISVWDEIYPFTVDYPSKLEAIQYSDQGNLVSYDHGFFFNSV